MYYLMSHHRVKQEFRVKKIIGQEEVVFHRSLMRKRRNHDEDERKQKINIYQVICTQMNEIILTILTWEHKSSKND